MATRADARSRRYDPAETRQRVLEAANLLFSTKGYAATGTADIARAADLSEGSIFYHFGSKRNLLIAIGRMYGERMIAVIQGDDALEDLEPGVIIPRCIDFCIEHREWETLVGKDYPEGRPKTIIQADAEPFYHAAREITAKWIALQLTAALGKRGIGGINVSCAASFTHAVIGAAIEAVLGTTDQDERAKMVAEAVRFIRGACGYPVA